MSGRKWTPCSRLPPSSMSCSSQLMSPTPCCLPAPCQHHTPLQYHASFGSSVFVCLSCLVCNYGTTEKDVILVTEMLAGKGSGSPRKASGGCTAAIAVAAHLMRPCIWFAFLLSTFLYTLKAPSFCKQQWHPAQHSIF